MATTNTRTITKIETGQAQKEITINDALDNLDKRDQILDLSGQTGGTVTLTSAQALCGTWKVSGTLTSNLTVKYPSSGYTREPFVHNATAGAFTVTVAPNSGGTGVAIAQGTGRRVYFDGTNVVYSSAEVVPASGVPHARVHHGANQSVANNTQTALAFNSERQDTAALHDTATNNSRLTAPAAGTYLVTASILFDVNATGARQIGFRVNGTTFYAVQAVQAITVAATGTPVAGSTVLTLAAGDYVEACALQTSGGALNVLAVGNYSPEFTMTRLF
jgi:hypothetical protein